MLQVAVTADHLDGRNVAVIELNCLAIQAIEDSYVGQLATSGGVAAASGAMEEQRPSNEYISKCTRTP